MQKLFFTGFFLLLLSICHGQNRMDKIAAISGSYRHSPPCTNCSGIETTLTLECGKNCNSGKYTLTDLSLNTINGENAKEHTGKWVITDTSAASNDAVIMIELLNSDQKDRALCYFKLNQGSLEQLDKGMREIEPPFNITLKKLDNGTILDLR